MTVYRPFKFFNEKEGQKLTPCEYGVFTNTSSHVSSTYTSEKTQNIGMIFTKFPSATVHFRKKLQI